MSRPPTAKARSHPIEASEAAREPTAKALRRGRLALLIETHDEALGAQATVAGARIGLEVRVVVGGRPLRLDPSGTLSHALRVEAVRSIAELRAARGARAFAFAARVSPRARRALEAHIDRKDDEGLRLGQVLPIDDVEGVHLREDEAGSIELVHPALAPIDLGEPPEADAAIREARARGQLGGSPSQGDVHLPEGAEERARAIVFGPSRTLSEPSSRRVLEAFGVDSARWQLAENGARAAACARVVGYPIDLRIASPEASAIDDATLASLGLRTPGEVREGYRSLTRHARSSVAAARVLGVIVARHIATTPTLRVTLERSGTVKGAAVEASTTMTIALDDPVGSKLTRPLVLPAPVDRASAAAALARFEGRGVLPALDTPRSDALIDLLVRLAKVTRVLGDLIERAEVAPIAPRVDDPGWLVGGARLRVRGVEIS